MILKMEKISVFGLLSDKDAVVSELMRERCIQMKSPETIDDYQQLEELTDSCSPDVYQAEVQLSRYAAALSSIAFYTTKAGLFSRRPRVLYDNLADSSLLERAEQLCGEIEGITGEISDLRGAKSKDSFLKTSLEPWLNCDMPLQEHATAQTRITYYLIPAKTNMEELAERRSQTAPYSHIEVISEDREQKYLFIICHNSQDAQLWEILKEYGASRMNFPDLVGTAQENISRIDKQIAALDEAIENNEKRLKELGADLFALKYAYDALSVKIQQQKSVENFRTTQKTFCFTAWVPESAKAQALDILDKYSCHYQINQCEEGEEAPILLKNSSLVSPYEAITEMYSLPSYWCMDPNFFVSIFYFLFFGMMLSDAGFGLILLLGGLFMDKKMDLTPSARKLVRVITMGGLSALIWGAIFGSWFGDLIPVVGRVFFNTEITVPQLIDPLKQAVLVMGLSMALGLVHIFVGMGLKGYLLVKRGRPWDALFDVGFWLLTLIGLVTILCAAIFFSTESIVFKIGAGMAIAGAAGLVLTQGRDKKNPFMKVAGGVMSLYDVTGYLSDVLSYSRILALGLATGVIAQVVNIMGTLGGGGILGLIVFIPVFLFGTALNLGINTLGSYVHTARLQYVEFFGKFYEAGGKPFMPLAAQTKYIVVTNEEEM